jgi:hypothetical protein
MKFIHIYNPNVSKSAYFIYKWPSASFFWLSYIYPTVKSSKYSNILPLIINILLLQYKNILVLYYPNAKFYFIDNKNSTKFFDLSITNLN